ncbi:hypothetical protein GCM10007242_44420 [Pigmentiphaga litoralis]|uniref:transcriptional regulator n=1 Tax=Pigmentiphaga litoralis TaxID=516702 RepID=UPI001679083D|nr:helix-turn-helix domain-containing protein [Pigmentiphaga litoralis]GGX32608.1 hypothetical protein GCM10007242_44420 [Pigmentiphaga litoralis]
MSRNQVVEKAVRVVGGQAALANACGVSPQAVSQWVNGIRPVPVEHCRAIEDATRGEVSRRDLCPTKWQSIWPELATLQEASHG